MRSARFAASEGPRFALDFAPNDPFPFRGDSHFLSGAARLSDTRQVVPQKPPTDFIVFPPSHSSRLLSASPPPRLHLPFPFAHYYSASCRALALFFRRPSSPATDAICVFARAAELLEYGLLITPGLIGFCETTTESNRLPRTLSFSVHVSRPPLPPSLSLPPRSSSLRQRALREKRSPKNRSGN